MCLKGRDHDLVADLMEIVKMRNPSLLPIVEKVGEDALSVDQRETLRELVAEELCANGLDEDDKLTRRGLLLEEIIDRLGHY